MQFLFSLILLCHVCLCLVLCGLDYPLEFQFQQQEPWPADQTWIVGPGRA